MPLRQQQYGAGSKPRQPNLQGNASLHGGGNQEEIYQQSGAGEDQDMQGQYQDQGAEGDNQQYDEDQGQEDWHEEEHEEEHEDAQNEEEDEGEKSGAGAKPDVGKLQHSKFPQDPHHSETMSLFHQIASEGFTEDHVHSFIHVLILIVAMLAYHAGMTAGHHKTHEAAAAAHQGGRETSDGAKKA